MAPPGSRKSQTWAQESEDENEAPESSQENLEFLNSAREAMAAAKKHREAKRKAVQEEHVKRTKDIKEKMHVLFDTRKNRVTKIQKAQWDRLYALNKKRLSLEGQILASMKSIEEHTANICTNLSAVLEGRKAETLEQDEISTN